MDSTPKHQNGRRALAIFEASKGALVLLAGFGLLSQLHKNVGLSVTEFIDRVHLNPNHQYPRIFIDLASKLTDAHLWTLAGLALVYASIRFVEAWGLWNDKTWAEWLAVISVSIYIPAEVYELSQGLNGIRLTALLINLAIIGYLSYLLYEKYRAKKQSQSIQ